MVSRDLVETTQYPSKFPSSDDPTVVGPFSPSRRFRTRPNFWGGKDFDQGQCHVPSMEYFRDLASYEIFPSNVAVNVCFIGVSLAGADPSPTFFVATLGILDSSGGGLLLELKVGVNGNDARRF